MKKNILVVDDSALMRRVICDIINSDNRFQAIDTCCDGLQAYEKLKLRRYDAVLCICRGWMDCSYWNAYRQNI